MTNRMTVVGWNQVFAGGMLPSIHIDDMETVGTAIVEDVETLKLRYIEDLKSVCGRPLPRTRRGFAARVGLVLQEIGVPIIDERPRPILQRNIVDVDRRVHR